MAVNLRASVRDVIKEQKKNIDQKVSELASLKDEVKRHERAYELLVAGRPRPRRMRRAGAVDWKSLLEGLPKIFTISSAALRGRLSAKAKTYLRSVLVRWVKQGKVKRIGIGKYQKA